MHFILCAADSVEVLYPQRTFTERSGSSVKLFCQAQYEPRCGQVHVLWTHLERNYPKLTDPEKYLTTVNETVTVNNMRRRQVVTEILNLNKKDKGTYQCHAECTNGEKAIGHVITVNVKGRG